MKGFILKITKAKNEDTIVQILSQKSVKKYYRFYGARHSVIQVGYLIDFEEEQEKSSFLPRLRKVTHIGFPWLYQRERIILWHNLISLLRNHLYDIENIENFYYDTLLDSAKKWHKQSPKRLLIEAVIKILSFEGRLDTLKSCTICNKALQEEKITLLPSLLAAHTECFDSTVFKKKDIFNLFLQKSTINLDDNEVEKLLPIILKGF